MLWICRCISIQFTNKDETFRMDFHVHIDEIQEGKLKEEKIDGAQFLHSCH